MAGIRVEPKRPAPWLRAVQSTYVPFGLVYMLGIWALWGDGSVLHPSGDRLSGLGQWLCFGWLPAAVAGLVGLMWNARGDGLHPWNARARRVFAVAFLMTLPGVVLVVERSVHALHRDRVACSGRLFCTVERNPESVEPAQPIEPNLRVFAQGAPVPTPKTLPEAADLARAISDETVPSEQDDSAPGSESGTAPSPGTPEPGDGAGPASDAGVANARPAGSNPASGPSGSGPLSSGPGGGFGAPGSARSGSGGAGSATDANAPDLTPDTAADTRSAASVTPDAPAESTSSLERYENGNKRRSGGQVLDPESGLWKKDGLWTEWAKNGRKVSEGRYDRGKKTGPWREWHENGKKKCEETFEDGRSTGPMNRWHENGQLALHRDELSTADGHVLWIEDAYFDNGAKQARHQLRDGVRQGPSEAWYRNRKQSETGAYASGSKDGIWLYWDDRGSEQGREVWVNGKLRGRPIRPAPPARSAP